VVDIQVAGQRVNDALLWQGVTDYAAHASHVLRFYDGVALGPLRAQPALDVSALGRLYFIDHSFSSYDAAALLEVRAGAQWGGIPNEATLREADPQVDGGSYDAAEALHRSYLAALPRLGPGIVSAALALCRPWLFPLLGPDTRHLYSDVAAKAWVESHKTARPFSRRTFWPVIRADLLQAGDRIAAWHERLAASDVEEEQWLSRVSDVRLWGIAVAHLAAGSAPGR